MMITVSIHESVVETDEAYAFVASELVRHALSFASLSEDDDDGVLDLDVEGMGRCRVVYGHDPEA